MTQFNAALPDLNKKYKQKKFLNPKILDVVFCIFLFFTVCNLIFSLMFIQAEVIGFSMQPTFNSRLSSDENPQTSIYKDIVFANKFYKGDNGDIILIQLENEVIIKRIVAKEGQTLTLKKEDDGFFYYFLNDKKIDESYIADSRQFMDENYFDKFCTVVGAEVVTPDEEAKLIIPSGKVFALGDNRKVSQDSTYHGPFDESQILGTVAFFYEYNQTLWGFFWDKICSIF